MNAEFKNYLKFLSVFQIDLSKIKIEDGIIHL